GHDPASAHSAYCTLVTSVWLNQNGLRQISVAASPSSIVKQPSGTYTAGSPPTSSVIGSQSPDSLSAGAAPIPSSAASSPDSSGGITIGSPESPSSTTPSPGGRMSPSAMLPTSSAPKITIRVCPCSASTTYNRPSGSNASPAGERTSSTPASRSFGRLNDSAGTPSSEYATTRCLSSMSVTYTSVPAGLTARYGRLYDWRLVCHILTSQARSASPFASNTLIRWFHVSAT